MPVQFEVSVLLPVSAQEIYDAWLDSTRHADMTGGAAEVSAQEGGEFSAWDGYISGRNLALSPARRILQSWRTIEFEESDPDSTLEVILEPAESGTLVTIRHSGLPAHGMQYKQGWVDSYFEPMQAYFQP